MNAVSRSTVVVGLDPSDPAQAAASCAAGVASRRNLPLRLVHALEGSQYALGPRPIGWTVDVEEVMQSSAQRLLDETTERLRGYYPGLEVTGKVQPGSANDALIEESEHAELLVLGSRGRGGFAELVIGSTTLHVASKARCPVVVVPGPLIDATPRKGVIVGVDGSELSDAAVQFAFQIASETHEKLTALHAWHDPAPTGIDLMMPLVYDPVLLEKEEQRILAESMLGWSEKYPEVEVANEVVRDHAVHALVTSAASATLLVVGSRGRGSVRGLLLGSVSHGVLHHASSSVAIVHPENRASRP
jgi:nucleotide-binding universal stress UspA family protein